MLRRFFICAKDARTLWLHGNATGRHGYVRSEKMYCIYALVSSIKSPGYRRDVYIVQLHITKIAYTDLDVERAGEHLVFELFCVEHGAGPYDLVGFHPPELESVVLVVAGTL